jgi:hypothetical protein
MNFFGWFNAHEVAEAVKRQLAFFATDDQS